MLVTILEVVLLLGFIIIPLRPQKNKVKNKSVIKIDTDTANAVYAIGKNGHLERVHEVNSGY